MYFLASSSDTANFIRDALRYVFASIDVIVYKVFEFLYTLFEYVAKVDMYDNDYFNYLLDRVWILIGVVALFSLAISIVKYVADPDSLSDKSKGAGALIKRTLISVILLISVNAIFNEARDIQNNIIFEGNINIVSRLLGNYNSNYQNLNTGQYIAVETFFGFVTDIDDPGFTVNNMKASVMNLSSSNNLNWNAILSNINLKDKETNVYYFDYNYLISTVAGGILVYIMACYCLSVGVRVFKLMFLQLISPLPIIMNITNKGQETFKTWVKQCTSTYLDLVIKLFIINLVLTFSKIVLDMELNFNGISDNMLFWVKVVLVLSLFIFANKALKMIKDLFPGMDSEDLNLKKTIGGMFGAKAIGGAIGAGGAMVVGGLGAMGGNIASGIKKDDNFFKVAGSALGGLGSGLMRGAKIGSKNGVKGGISGIVKSGEQAWTAASHARNMRQHEFGMKARFEDKMTELTGIKNESGTTSQVKNRINYLQRELDNITASENAARESWYRRNENYSPLQQEQITKFFDFYQEKDKNGKPTKYEEKTYNAYLEEYAKTLYDNNKDNQANGLTWDKLDDEGKQKMAAYYSSSGDILSESEFNDVNAGYRTITTLDTNQKLKEKEINDLKSDLDKKGGNKPK